jgi:hypothetical protein
MANKKPQPKVIIALPCTDSGSMKARTAHSIGCAIIGGAGVVVDFLLRMSCDIVSSRTWLVNEAIKRGATHILFVDADMAFSEDALRRMLAHGKEIVAVQYNKRELPLTPVYEPLNADEVQNRVEDKLYKAKHAGTGLMLIDLSIFPKLKGPYFNFGRDSQGALVLGEDVWFCNTARDAGFDTWIDPTIKVGHVGEFVY